MKRLVKKSQEGGFSLLEVLIAILAVTAFLMGTLQLTAVAALYKLLSKQQANASLWIQADIEEVQALAANIAQNDALCNPTTLVNPPYSPTNLPNSYAGTLRYQIETSTTLPGSTTKSLLGGSYNKLYQMNRTYSTITTAKPNALEITYTVVDINASNGTNQDLNTSTKATVARNTVVVVPAAAFKCP